MILADQLLYGLEIERTTWRNNIIKRRLKKNTRRTNHELWISSVKL